MTDEQLTETTSDRAEGHKGDIGTEDFRSGPESLYHENLDNIPAHMSTLLSSYSKIKFGDQKAHVLQVRDRAYKSHPYPCLGRFRFLELDLSTHPLYESYVLPRLKETWGKPDATFLDLGTCLGQDIRKLIFDGARPSWLFGSDIIPEFIDAGYELFQDEKSFGREHFIVPGDVFDDSPDNALSKLDGKVDILHATAVFHLFSKEEQAAVARRCLRLLKRQPRPEGGEIDTRSLILGGQAGNIDAQENVRKDGAKKYRHNEESWRNLWEEVAQEGEFRDTVKGLEVKAEMQMRYGEAQQKQIGPENQGFRWMVWQVWVQF